MFSFLQTAQTQILTVQYNTRLFIIYFFHEPSKLIEVIDFRLN